MKVLPKIVSWACAIYLFCWKLPNDCKVNCGNIIFIFVCLNGNFLLFRALEHLALLTIKMVKFRPWTTFQIWPSIIGNFLWCPFDNIVLIKEKLMSINTVFLNDLRSKAKRKGASLEDLIEEIDRSNTGRIHITNSQFYYIGDCQKRIFINIF